MLLAHLYVYLACINILTASLLLVVEGRLRIVIVELLVIFSLTFFNVVVFARRSMGSNGPEPPSHG